MILRVLFTASCFLMLCVGARAQEKGWRGIVPLRSTREDVERLLGPSSDRGYGVTYILKDQSVFFEYSSCHRCDDKENCFNVPEYTVIRIAVSLVVKPRISNLGVDKKKFKKERNPNLPDYWYYTNAEEGIVYEVLNDDLVMSTTFQAALEDYKSLKCVYAAK